MTMKKVLMVLVAAMLMMGMATGAQAFSVGDNYTLRSVNPVSFYLVDWGQFDYKIVMTATTENGIGYLQYSFDNNKWSPFTAGIDKTSGTAEITPPSSHTQLMYLRYLDDGKYDYDADYMRFTSWTTNSGTLTGPQKLDLFNGLIIRFSGAEITFASNAANDKFAPVPIPPTAYLLGVGLLGLVGLRRRFTK
jgi:hypothetical protein